MNKFTVVAGGRSIDLVLSHGDDIPDVADASRALECELADPSNIRTTVEDVWDILKLKGVKIPYTIDAAGASPAGSVLLHNDGHRTSARFFPSEDVAPLDRLLMCYYEAVACSDWTMQAVIRRATRSAATAAIPRAMQFYGVILAQELGDKLNVPGQEKLKQFRIAAAHPCDAKLRSGADGRSIYLPHEARVELDAMFEAIHAELTRRCRAADRPTPPSPRQFTAECDRYWVNEPVVGSSLRREVAGYGADAAGPGCGAPPGEPAGGAIEVTGHVLPRRTDGAPEQAEVDRDNPDITEKLRAIIGCERMEPGTLNILVPTAAATALDRMRPVADIPPEQINYPLSKTGDARSTAQQGWRFWRAEVAGKARAAKTELILARRGRKPLGRLVELVAGFNIKKRLQLHDGDGITIIIHEEPLNEPNADAASDD